MQPPSSSNLAPTHAQHDAPASIEIRSAGPRVVRVAAIIVTWNRKAFVESVIEAIKGQTFDVSHLDVIVVDNASTDGTTDALMEKFKPERLVENPTDAAHQPNFCKPAQSQKLGSNAMGFRSLTIVRNQHNLGGCGGFNTGFAYIEEFVASETDGTKSSEAPDYVWLVDDDIDLPTTALKQLTFTAEADELIGLVGSRAVDFNDRETTIESTIYFDHERGRMHDSPLESSPHHAGHVDWIKDVKGTKGPNTGPFSGVRDVDVVSACSMLARWNAIQQVGYWDYRYFIYCDDADWCLRFAKQGFRVVCDLDAVVYHTPWYQKLTPARLYYSQRNIVWLIQKTFPSKRLKYATLRWLGSILSDCLQAAFHRRVFHAEIIRRTASDIVANRGGKLDEEGPSRTGAVECLRSIGAVKAGQHIAVMCSHVDAVRWAEELRAELVATGGPDETGASEPQWTYFVRNDVSLDGINLEGVECLVYSNRLRSKLFRQIGTMFNAPRAVVVFDQTNDFPLFRGRYNVHIDRKWPDQAQLERDGFMARAGFMMRWGRTCLSSVWYSLWVGPYKSPHKFG